MPTKFEINVEIKTKCRKGDYVSFEIIKAICNQMILTMSYYDGEKVVPMSKDISKSYYGKTMVIYNERKYGRGLDLITLPDGIIALKQTLPASSQDIMDFYTLLLVLLKTFKCKNFCLGGEKCKEKDGVVILKQMHFSGNFLNENRDIKIIKGVLCDVELDDKFYNELAMSTNKQEFLDNYLDKCQRK